MKDQNPTRPYIIGGTVLLIAAAGFAAWYIRRQKTKTSQQAGNDTGISIGNDSPSATVRPPRISPGRKTFRCVSSSYPLRYGTCHPDVKVLQTYLKTHKADLGKGGPNKNGVDGKFGTQTAQAAQSVLGKASFGTTDIAGMKMTLKMKKV